MERKDLISKNAEGMKAQASALNQYASTNCKIIVIANPANTNCLVAIKSCPNIPAQNFTCLTRLDEERFRNAICEKLNQYYNNNDIHTKIFPSSIQNICIFGNHSSTQVPFMEHGTCIYKDKKQLLPKAAFANQYEEIVRHIQTRGAQILEKLKNSSAMSCATAIEKHIQDWIGEGRNDGHDDDIFSMGVLSDGSYGVPQDIVVST
jgi:malate dehydrogenase